MHPIITFIAGFIGGAIAVQINAPIPWLLGSLLATALISGAGTDLYKPPPSFEGWMRVLVGTALGPSVAQSLMAISTSLFLIMFASMLSVVLLVLIGAPLFRKYLSMTQGEAYLSSLPGGLSFMMALADDLGTGNSASRPRIALVHTVRVVALVLFISMIAAFVGTDKPQYAFVHWFSLLPAEAGAVGDWRSGDSIANAWQWVVLLIVIVGSAKLAKLVAIPGGNVTIPLLVSSLVYAIGLLSMPMPPLVLTVAMIVFGSILGCELGTGPRHEYPRLAAGSVMLTTCAFVIGTALAVGLGKLTGFGFLTMFLALAPGGIAEVALISLALGLDVGLIALVHLCRFMFIMLVGPIGLRIIAARLPADSSSNPPSK